VGGPTISNNVNPVEDVVEEEVVGIDIKESPLEKLSKFVGRSASEATRSEEDDIVEEEVVPVEIKGSTLDKLARMMD
jgi:hypothetical protein